MRFLSVSVLSLLGRQLPRVSLRSRDVSACATGAGSVGVIGGGIAGVTAARFLADAGVPVVLHERERSLGGRLSPTAYIKGKDPEFLKQLEEWQSDGILTEWTTAKPHLIQAPGIWAPLAEANAERWFVAGRLGSPTSLSDAERAVISVEHHDVYDVNHVGSSWVVAAQQPLTDGSLDLEEEGPLASHLHAALIVATPVHEATFLERKILDRALGRGRYKDFVKERFSIRLVFDDSLGLPFNFAAITHEGSPVTVAICESSRCEAAGVPPADDGSESWILQSATDWARRALDDELEPSAIQQALLDAFTATLDQGDLPAVRKSEVVLWPYGNMDYQVDGGCVWIEELGLAMAGDWCFDGRVEGAWLSGRAAARQVIEQRSLH